MKVLCKDITLNNTGIKYRTRKQTIMQILFTKNFRGNENKIVTLQLKEPTPA